MTEPATALAEAPIELTTASIVPFPEQKLDPVPDAVLSRPEPKKRAGRAKGSKDKKPRKRNSAAVAPAAEGSAPAQSSLMRDAGAPAALLQNRIAAGGDSFGRRIAAALTKGEVWFLMLIPVVTTGAAWVAFRGFHM